MFCIGCDNVLFAEPNNLPATNGERAEINEINGVGNEEYMGIQPIGRSVVKLKILYGPNRRSGTGRFIWKREKKERQTRDRVKDFDHLRLKLTISKENGVRM